VETRLPGNDRGDRTRRRVRNWTIEQKSLSVASNSILIHPGLVPRNEPDADPEERARCADFTRAGKPVSQLSKRPLGRSLRKLERHSLVRIDRGFDADDDGMVEVMPLVEKVLPDDRIQEIAQRIKAYVTAKPSLARSDNETEPDLDVVSDEAERETSS
jgi:hypothetical protein